LGPTLRQEFLDKGGIFFSWQQWNRGCHLFSKEFLGGKRPKVPIFQGGQEKKLNLSYLDYGILRFLYVPVNLLKLFSQTSIQNWLSLVVDNGGSTYFTKLKKKEPWM
jgi:hypothetical protein